MAKKYIDADLLKAEVEKRKKANQQDATESGAGAFYEDKAVLQLINSLQQEQPCDTCTNDKGCVTCKDGELWEGKEQPCEDLDLEKEIDKTVNECTDGYNFDWDRFARHFYELGKNSK